MKHDDFVKSLGWQDAPIDGLLRYGLEGRVRYRIKVFVGERLVVGVDDIGKLKR